MQVQLATAEIHETARRRSDVNPLSGDNAQATNKRQLWHAETLIVTPRSFAPPGTCLRTSGIQMRPSGRQSCAWHMLNQVLELRKLSQAEAAKVLGVIHPPNGSEAFRRTRVLTAHERE
jgi:hypothetical protein